MHLDTHSPVAPPSIEDLLGGLQGEELECLAWVEGMMTAAVVGPERVLPAECMHAMLGKDYVYESAALAQSLLSAVALMQGVIAAELRQFGRDYQPRVLRDAPHEERLALATLWAEGFMGGVRLRPDSWGALFRSEEIKMPFGIVMAFLDRPRALEAAGSEERLVQIRTDLLPSLGTAAYLLWRHTSGSPKTAAARPKVGRNEPCPCGSGKKYKKCCLGGAE